jgi:ABC-type glycerol-3-phosphate transport system substrate-binding protein
MFIFAALLISSCTLTARRTLILWHTLDGARERALLNLVDAWNADVARDVVVVPQRRTPSAQHAAFLAGQVPDVAVVSAAQAAVYAEQGVLRPLDDLVQGVNGFGAVDRGDLFPFVFAVGRTVDGSLVGLPLGGDVRLMIFDADWMTESGLAPPVDGPSLLRLCEQAQQTGACFVARQDDVLLQEWLNLNDVSLLTVDRMPQIGAPRAVDALSVLVESMRSGAALAAVSDAQVLNEFAAGRAVLMFEWSSRLREASRLITSGAGRTWDVAPVPAARSSSTGIVRAPLLVVPRTNADREAEAWHFVHWMLDTTQTARWATDTDEFPARLSAVTVMDPAQLPSKYVAAVQRAGGSARSEPLLAAWPCVVDGLGRSALQLVNTPSITDALESAQLQMVQNLGAPCALR